MNPPKHMSPFRLVSVLRNVKDPKLALYLFQNSKTSSKPFHYSLHSYDLIITKLGRAKMFEEMQKVLNQLRTESRFVPKEALFCNVIAFYGRAHLPDDARRMFEEIPSFGCQRTIKSINSLLAALLKSNDFDKVRELLVGIERFAKPDACTYNILIRELCSAGRLDDAQKLFDEMRQRDVSPDVVTFGILIYGLCLDFRLKEALKLKDDMVRVYGVHPNVHVYASLIKGLSGAGELDLALRLKEDIVRKKITMDPAIYSTLISGLFKAGRKLEAFRVFEEMSITGCKPDTVTYNVIINGYCKDKEFEAAYKVLDEMVEKGCKPNVDSYNTILGELCKEGKWCEANDLFEDMPRRGCAPDVVSHRILFDGLCDGMQLKEAAFILDEMIFKGFAPRSAGVYAFVDKLCLRKKAALLWSVLNSLCNANAIDVDSWGIAVDMVIKDDELSSTLKLVDRLYYAVS